VSGTERALLIVDDNETTATRRDSQREAKPNHDRGNGKTFSRRAALTWFC
jgi:hypothetical protein